VNKSFVVLGFWRQTTSLSETADLRPKRARKQLIIIEILRFSS
jgi:hypothetical protein